jgi:cytochrome c551/c552
MSSDFSTGGASVRRRGPLPWVLGGCVLLLLCAALACAALVVYWIVGGPSGINGLAPALAPLEFAALPPGVAADGTRAFERAGCEACHALTPGTSGVGPSLAGIGARAAARKPGYTAEEYLLESVINPNAYVVAGFHGDIMPQTYQRQFSEQDLADLVAFLLTQ